MKTLRERIEEILISYFVDKDKDNHWGTIERTDQLLSLFTQEMDKIPCCGHSCCCNLVLHKGKRTEQLKKVRGVRK